MKQPESPESEHPDRDPVPVPPASLQATAETEGNYPDLYLVAECGEQDQEKLVRELVAPIVAEIRDHPELESLFFVRMSKPTWQVRLRVVGDLEWLQNRCRRVMCLRLDALRGRRAVHDFSLGHYGRELERYGGEGGMRIAEQLYHHDSLACLDLITAEARGLLERSRRELALLYSERLANRLGLHGEDRSRFYRYGYQWTFQTETWDQSDADALEERFEQLEAGLRSLFPLGGKAPPETDLWGGDEPARVGAGLAASQEPALARLLKGHRAGRIGGDLAYLGWSYCHLFCNRLGIDPSGEAVQRYLMHLYHYRVRAQGSLPGPLLTEAASDT